MQESTSAPVADETVAPITEETQEELTLDSFRKQLQTLGTSHRLQTRIAFTDYQDEEGEEGERLKAGRIAELNRIESEILTLIKKALDTFPVEQHKNILMDARSYVEDSQYIFEQLFLETRAELRELKGKGNGVETKELGSINPESLTTSHIQGLIGEGATLILKPAEPYGLMTVELRKPKQA